MSFVTEDQICLTLWINDSSNEGFRFDMRGKIELTFDVDITVKEMLDDIKDKLDIDPYFNVISVSKRMSTRGPEMVKSQNIAKMDWRQADARSGYLNDNLPETYKEVPMMPRDRLSKYNLQDKEDIMLYFACKIPENPNLLPMEEPIAKPKEEDLGKEWNDLPTFTTLESSWKPTFTKRTSIFDDCDDWSVRGPTCSSNPKMDYNDRLLDDD